MASAAEHAIIASQLLDQIAQVDDQVRGMTDDQRLQAIATGDAQRINEAVNHSLKLAAVNALTALALTAAPVPD